MYGLYDQNYRLPLEKIFELNKLNLKMKNITKDFALTTV